jgi:hypothetical protein
MPRIDDPVSEDEEESRASDNGDDEDDPDWVSGQTPAAFEKRPISRVMRVKVSSVS